MIMTILPFGGRFPPTFTSAHNAENLNDDEVGVRFLPVSNFYPFGAIGIT